MRTVATRVSAHPFSEAVAREAGRYLLVIDHVLAMNYLKPDLRRRVVNLQRNLIQIELNAHYPTGGQTPGEDGQAASR